MRWAVYDELIEQITRQAPHDEDDVRQARTAWEGLTGEVRADHELYHERSDAFVEWYLLERRGADGRTPIERALAAATEEGERAALRSLRGSQRSLYRVEALRPGGLIIDDLYGGGRFDVDERRRLPGVQTGDIFEARLLADPETAYRLLLGRAVLFHPREAGRVVAAMAGEARRQREPRSALCNRLLRLRLKALAYRHVAPERIYASGQSGSGRSGSRDLRRTGSQPAA